MLKQNSKGAEPQEEQHDSGYTSTLPSPQMNCIEQQVNSSHLYDTSTAASESRINPDAYIVEHPYNLGQQDELNISLFPSFLVSESRPDFVAPKDLYGSQPHIGVEYSQTPNRRGRELNPVPASDKTFAEAEVYNIHNNSYGVEYEGSDSDDNSFIAPSTVNDNVSISSSHIEQRMISAQGY